MTHSGSRHLLGLLVLASGCLFSACLVGRGDIASTAGGASAAGSGGSGIAGSGAGGSGAGVGGSGGGGDGVGGLGAGGQMMGMTPMLGGATGSIAPGGVMTKLPRLPELVNVQARPNDDSAHVVFDPYVGAKDYRIYELPTDAELKLETDGTTTIPNGIYRCAGMRYGAPAPLDNQPQLMSGAVKTRLNSDVRGFTRTMADATLGHVWVTPGPGRIPVYAVGDPRPNADNSECYFQRWTASRVKKYITSEQERTMLLAQRWRDDGVVFYVPAPGTANTTAVYTSVKVDGKFGARYYFAEGPERAVRDTPTVAFQVLAQPGADTQPLMRVFYDYLCGTSHDELVPGQAQFERVLRQGPIPLAAVMWSPLKEEKILVVEALDRGCPYQGVLAKTAFPSYSMYEPFFTLEQLRTTVFTGPGLAGTGPNPTGEVFVNGQADGGQKPRAIARSFVKIGPRPHQQMDWFADFKDGVELPPFTPHPSDPLVQFVSDEYNMTWYALGTNTAANKLQWSMGPVLGELRSHFHDAGGDVNGKFRLTPTKKATLSANSYLHVTMETGVFSSRRRYPQIMISNQPAPVQSNMVKGLTMVVQTFGEWPIDVQVQWCDKRMWDVDHQCPGWDMYRTGGLLAPGPEIAEKSGLDWRVRFDVYASSRRMFVFVDGQPYGCTDLPGNGFPAGETTVTFGDVLYHSLADLGSPWYPFHRVTGTERPHHMLVVAQRSFDNLGFSSGVPAPGWNFALLPCQARMTP